MLKERHSCSVFLLTSDQASQEIFTPTPEVAFFFAKTIHVLGK
jgi:predicted PhzF superfamily epimerase YddE/YHI9